jgi:outer membrane protein
MTKFKLALLAAAIAAPAAQAQNVPAAVIAVVDRDRILAQCTACVAASGQIQTQVQQAQARAQALGAPLQTEGQAIQAEAQRVQALPAGAPRTAAENALRQRAQAFEAKRAAADQELGKLQENIRSIQQNVVRQISEKLNPVVTTVMTQRGANIAIDTDATIAIAKGVDVTDAVLAALNAQLPSVSVTPLPAQAAPATTQPAKPVGR